MLQKKNVFLASAVLAASFFMGNVFAAGGASSQMDFGSLSSTTRSGDAYWTPTNQRLYIQALEARRFGLTFNTEAQARDFAGALNLNPFFVQPFGEGYTLTQDKAGIKPWSIRVTADNFKYAWKYRAFPYFSTRQDATGFARAIGLTDYIETRQKEEDAFYLTNAKGLWFGFTANGYEPYTRSKRVNGS